jgi:hypothetical protein
MVKALRSSGAAEKAGLVSTAARPPGTAGQPGVGMRGSHLLVGYGEQFDEGKMKALPAGSTFTEPARHPHFAWAKDGEVVVQVVGHGPSDTTWLPR